MSSLQLHVLSAGRLSMRKSVYIPGAAREEMIELPVLSFLLRHAQGNVLFDTGCHPDAATDPQGRWGGMSRIMRMVSPPQEHLLNSLAEVGLQPQDIDVVVNSHLHTDHCGCNVFFRRATVHVHAAELAAARADDAEQQPEGQDGGEQPDRKTARARHSGFRLHCSCAIRREPLMTMRAPEPSAQAISTNCCSGIDSERTSASGEISAPMR